MRKKQLMVLAAAGLLTLSFQTLAMAEVTIDGESKGTGNISISGDVTGSNGVTANSDSDNVVINGDITSAGNGVDASNGATVEVKGEVEGKGYYGDGINAQSGASVSAESASGGQFGVWADGDNTTVDITGEVTGNGWSGTAAIEANNGTVVTAGSAKGVSYGVNAIGKNTTVTVTNEVVSTGESVFGNAIQAYKGATVNAGSATSMNSGTAIFVYDGATVNVGCAMAKGTGSAIRASNGAIVNASDAVSNQGYGVYASGDGTIVTVSENIEGHAHGTGIQKSGTAIWAHSGAVVNAGSVTGSGIVAMLDSVVNIGGSVESDETAIRDSAGATVFVAGDAKSQSGYSVSLGLSSYEDDKAGSVEILGNATGGVEINAAQSDALISKYGSVENVAENAGRIIVSSITPNAGQSAVTVQSTDAALTKAISENMVYYIVNTEKTRHGTITITQASNIVEVKDAAGNAMKDANGNTLYAANRSQTVTVNIATVPGYEVIGASGGKASLTRNSDGSYTLTIPEGGGVDIKAIIAAIGGSDSSNDNGTQNIPITYVDGTKKITGVSGWVSVGDSWIYANNEGVLKKDGWAELEYGGIKGWYNFDSNSVMRTGWIKDLNGKWYYLNPISDGTKGKMLTGWVTDSKTGYIYYLDPDTGEMIIGDKVISGKKYRFAESENGSLPLGAMVKSE